MALFGRTDTLEAAPKFITRKATFDAQAAVSSSGDTIDLTNSNTNFATGDGVVYTGASGIGLTQGTAYYVKKLTAGTIQLTPTEAGSKTGATGINLTAGATGAIGYLQRNLEGNESTGATGVGDHNYNGQQLIFVDANEAAQAETRAKGIKHPGWWLYRTWTNADGSIAQHAENVVAMSAYAHSGVGASGATGSGTYQAQTGDAAADDAIAIDATTSITVQPANRSVTAPAGTTFAVTSTATGAYGSLTYLWQVSDDEGDTWTTATGGVYSDGDTATLSLSDTTGLDGYLFRVICGTDTANTNAISNAATLTVAEAVGEVTYTAGIDWVIGNTTILWNGSIGSLSNNGDPWTNTAAEAIFKSQPVGTVYACTTSTVSGNITTTGAWSGNFVGGTADGDLIGVMAGITSVTFTPA